MIAFVVALLVFGTLGYYAYPYIKDVSDDFLRPGAETEEPANTGTPSTHAVDTLEPSDPELPPDDPSDFEGQQSFTLLLFGSNYQPDVFSDYRVSVSTSPDIEVLATHQRHYSADVIVIVRYSAELGVVMFSAVPSNLTVTAGGISMRLGDVLEKKNVTYFVGAVEAVTGLTVDYYVYCQISLMKDVIDRLGGVKYDVPQDMYFVDPEERIVEPGASREPVVLRDKNGAIIYDQDGNPKTVPPGKDFVIDLKKGIQTLNGEKATWVLRYNSYSNGYTGYRSTQVSFFRVLFEQVMKEEYSVLLQKIVSDIIKSPYGSTNLSVEGFNEIADTLLNYSAYEKTSVVFPGNPLPTSDGESFSYTRIEVYNTYAKYKLK